MPFHSTSGAGNNRRRWVLAALVGFGLVVGSTTGVAASTVSTPVGCTITDNALSCPLPAPAPITVTATTTERVTTTVAPAAMTVTATQTVTAAPSSTASSTPTPTPTPTGSSTTPSSSTTTPPPTTGAWPGADNTGIPAGVSLTASGGITVTQAGTVIDGKDITGSVVVRAANVVIKNSRIKGSSTYCVQTQNGGSVTIEDTEIIGGCENAIGFDGWTARRVEIRGTYGDGVKLGSNVLLVDSWIHDLAPASGAHSDGGQVQSGVTNTTVRHNVIDLGSTPQANAALFLAPDLGPSTNGPLTIDGNKLNGGNYILFCVDGNNGQYHIKNIGITNNRFGNTFQYGRARVNEPVTQAGNVVDSTGAALTL